MHTGSDDPSVEGEPRESEIMRHLPPHRYRHHSSADRQRRHHSRIMNGRMIIRVEISDVAVPEALIAAGLLSRDARDDRAAIGRAIEQVIEDYRQFIEALVAADASAHNS